MARRSFRDRFFTPPVARAMTSPLGILLAGLGAAVGIVLIGNPIAAAGLAAAAWAARVGAAVPGNKPTDRIDPFTLSEPWKLMVQDALQAQNRFAEAINSTDQGPLRDRMTEIGERIADGVQHAWRVGRQGQNLVEARRRIDTNEALQELAEVEAQARGGVAADSPLARTAAALNAELATAQRLDQTIAEAHDRLRLTNARLDEAVARATELSVAAGDVHDLDTLGTDVDALVTDLEALRLGIEEVNRPATGMA